MEAQAMRRRRETYGFDQEALRQIPTEGGSICDLPIELLVFIFLMCTEKSYLPISEVCAHWYHTIMHAREFAAWRFNKRVAVISRNLNRIAST